MERCYLCLGSNLSDKVGMISRAIGCLCSHGGVAVSAVSSFYKTSPWGDTTQPDFINAVVEIYTHLSPSDLLWLAKSIESNLGRKQRRRWGPREIDIDILLYGCKIVDSDDLTIPHPRMCERGFVMAPLAELNPDLVHPTWGIKVIEILESIRQMGAEKWEVLLT